MTAALQLGDVQVDDRAAGEYGRGGSLSMGDEPARPAGGRPRLHPATPRHAACGIQPRPMCAIAPSASWRAASSCAPVG